ncbi:hypothetical protein DICPUDRAFT_29922 [Dictyostelium purpureum]|uniref:Acyl-coenzyme A thioesterase 13 n=1 Tax=Dictyostelium purpureum TaxID=5786 RepID=F0ZEF0_DICPU|nr:uncharacterized protein DICPUDRAFT_29922 [Dictyostelium purpureum]EGC37681.1 hypothetical protein DICPUDRAFT_29922 [Dictyostelium purpureum]|eukprot:XP_003285785.1 hypothetical protein DICPUDRAFT_29922 [Dictyostelium purpureum]
MATNEERKEKLLDLLQKWVQVEGFDSGFIEPIKCERVEHGKVVFSTVVQQKQCNVLSTLHGGAIATYIDIISSLAIISLNLDKVSPSVSVEISVNYSSSAPVDRKIYFISNVYKTGRSLAFTDTTIRLDSEEGQIVAKGSHTKFLPIQKKSKL